MFKRQLKKSRTLERKHETVQRKAEQSVLFANKGILILIVPMPIEWRQNE